METGYYAVNGKNLDAVAQAIRDAKGCVIGVEGDNIGWRDLKNPKPPVNYEWGHALYCFGFHRHVGRKCIIAKSSWCNTGITEHHIKANYFESGNTFDGWTLIPKEKLPMYQRCKVFHQATGREGVLVVGETGSTDSILWAKNEATFRATCNGKRLKRERPRIKSNAMALTVSNSGIKLGRGTKPTGQGACRICGRSSISIRSWPTRCSPASMP